MARVNVAKSVLLDGPTRAAYDLSRSRVQDSGRAVPALSPTPTRGRRYDRNAALMLVTAAPLVVALLLYVATGVQVAARPVPLLVC